LMETITLEDLQTGAIRLLLAELNW